MHTVDIRIIFMFSLFLVIRSLLYSHLYVLVWTGDSCMTEVIPLEKSNDRARVSLIMSVNAMHVPYSIRKYLTYTKCSLVKFQSDTNIETTPYQQNYASRSIQNAHSVTIRPNTSIMVLILCCSEVCTIISAYEDANMDHPRLEMKLQWVTVVFDNGIISLLHAFKTIFKPLFALI